MSGHSLYITSRGGRRAAEVSEQMVRSTRGANGVAIRCAGEFDAGTCGPLRLALAQACVGDGVRVLLDLSGTTFVDGHALGLIVETAHRLSDRGGTLVLALGPGQPRRLAELTGLAALLDA